MNTVSRDLEPLLVKPQDWQGKPVPARESIVDGWIPANTVTLLGGDGGTGKTIIGLQLAAARALARDWLGRLPRPGRTLVLSAEDDRDELHRRLDAIRAHYGVSFAEL